MRAASLLRLLIALTATSYTLCLTVLLLPGNLRVHNNPCFQYLQQSKTNINEVTSVAYFPSQHLYRDEILLDLQERYARVYGASIDCVNDLHQLANKLKGTVVYCKDGHADCVRQVEEAIITNRLHSIPVHESFSLPFNELEGPLHELQFPFFEQRYRSLMNNLPFSDLAPLLSANSSHGYGESLALQLLNDYLSMSEESFDETYSDRYIQHMARSVDHIHSLQRLAKAKAFFRGEVFSGLMGDLASLGCISPGLLASQTSGIGFTFLRPPKNYLISSDAIRRDWHRTIALYSEHQTLASSTPHWQVKFTYWRGFMQRLTYLSTNNQRNSTSDTVFVLLHGFGGSADQFEGLASALSRHLVVSLDMVSGGSICVLFAFHCEHNVDRLWPERETSSELQPGEDNSPAGRSSLSALVFMAGSSG